MRGAEAMENPRGAEEPAATEGVLRWEEGQGVGVEVAEGGWGFERECVESPFFLVDERSEELLAGLPARWGGVAVFVEVEE